MQCTLQPFRSAAFVAESSPLRARRCGAVGPPPPSSRRVPTFAVKSCCSAVHSLLLFDDMQGSPDAGPSALRITTPAPPPAETIATGAGSAEPERRKGTRGARACVRCRRIKKTVRSLVRPSRPRRLTLFCPGRETGQCEGGSAPCVRCKQAGAECVFDKPASSVVEDA